MALNHITEQAESVPLPTPSGRQHQLPRSRRTRYCSCCLAPSPQPVSLLSPKSASSLSPVLHPSDPALFSPSLSWALLQHSHQAFFTPAFPHEIPFLIFPVSVSTFTKSQLKCHLLQEASRDFPGRAHCFILCALPFTLK